MDVMYRAGEAGGEIDYQKKLFMISNALSYFDKVNVKDLALECIIFSNIISFQGGEVFLSGLKKKGEFDIIFNGEEGEISILRAQPRKRQRLMDWLSLNRFK
jgi:hypothetical protein